MDNHMEKTMENSMETGIMHGLYIYICMYNIERFCILVAHIILRGLFEVSYITSIQAIRIHNIGVCLGFYITSRKLEDSSETCCFQYSTAREVLINMREALSIETGLSPETQTLNPKPQSP